MRGEYCIFSRCIKGEYEIDVDNGKPSEINRMRKSMNGMDEYKRGYQRALEDINMPMAVVADRWKPSACPRCNESFADYERCNDGYYKRAVNLYRCPFCGQKLDWDVVDL